MMMTIVMNVLIMLTSIATMNQTQPRRPSESQRQGTKAKQSQVVVAHAVAPTKRLQRKIFVGVVPVQARPRERDVSLKVGVTTEW
jgi:hypothetical protein